MTGLVAVSWIREILASGSDDDDVDHVHNDLADDYHGDDDGADLNLEIDLASQPLNLEVDSDIHEAPAVQEPAGILGPGNKRRKF